MSTRGVYGFQKGDIQKKTYMHADAYPQGLGKDIVQFLGNHTFEELNKIFDQIIMVDVNQPAPLALQNKYRPYADLTVNTQRLSDWYCLLRETQGNLEVYTSGDVTHMIQQDNFEDYGYIINLDNHTLDFYHGSRLIEEYPLEKCDTGLEVAGWTSF